MSDSKLEQPTIAARLKQLSSILSAQFRALEEIEARNAPDSGFGQSSFKSAALGIQVITREKEKMRKIFAALEAALEKVDANQERQNELEVFRQLYAVFVSENQEISIVGEKKEEEEGGTQAEMLNVLFVKIESLLEHQKAAFSQIISELVSGKQLKGEEAPPAEVLEEKEGAETDGPSAKNRRQLGHLLNEMYTTEASFILMCRELISGFDQNYLVGLTLDERIKIEEFLIPYRQIVEAYDEEFRGGQHAFLSPTDEATAKLAVTNMLRWVEKRKKPPVSDAFLRGTAKYIEFSEFVSRLFLKNPETERLVKNALNSPKYDEKGLQKLPQSGLGINCAYRISPIFQRVSRYDLLLKGVGKCIEPTPELLKHYFGEKIEVIASEPKQAGVRLKVKDEADLDVIKKQLEGVGYRVDIIDPNNIHVTAGRVLPSFSDLALEINAAIPKSGAVTEMRIKAESIDPAHVFSIARGTVFDCLMKGVASCEQDRRKEAQKSHGLSTAAAATPQIILQKEEALKKYLIQLKSCTDCTEVHFLVAAIQKDPIFSEGAGSFSNVRQILEKEWADFRNYLSGRQDRCVILPSGFGAPKSFDMEFKSYNPKKEPKAFRPPSSVSELASSSSSTRWSFRPSLPSSAAPAAQGGQAPPERKRGFWGQLSRAFSTSSPKQEVSSDLLEHGIKRLEAFQANFGQIINRGMSSPQGPLGFMGNPLPDIIFYVKTGKILGSAGQAAQEELLKKLTRFCEFLRSCDPALFGKNSDGSFVLSRENLRTTGITIQALVELRFMGGGDVYQPVSMGEEYMPLPAAHIVALEEIIGRSFHLKPANPESSPFDEFVASYVTAFLLENNIPRMNGDVLPEEETGFTPKFSLDSVFMEEFPILQGSEIQLRAQGPGVRPVVSVQKTGKDHTGDRDMKGTQWERGSVDGGVDLQLVPKQDNDLPKDDSMTPHTTLTASKPTASKPTAPATFLKFIKTNALFLRNIFIAGLFTSLGFSIYALSGFAGPNGFLMSTLLSSPLFAFALAAFSIVLISHLVMQPPKPSLAVKIRKILAGYENATPAAKESLDKALLESVEDAIEFLTDLGKEGIVSYNGKRNVSRVVEEETTPRQDDPWQDDLKFLGVIYRQLQQLKDKQLYVLDQQPLQQIATNIETTTIAHSEGAGSTTVRLLVSASFLILCMERLFSLFTVGTTLTPGALALSLLLTAVLGIASWYFANSTLNKTSAGPYATLAVILGAAIIVLSTLWVLNGATFSLPVLAVGGSLSLLFALSVGFAYNAGRTPAERTAKFPYGNGGRFLLAAKVASIVASMFLVLFVLSLSHVGPLNGILDPAFNAIAKSLGFAGLQTGGAWMGVVFLVVFPIFGFIAFKVREGLFQAGSSTEIIKGEFDEFTIEDRPKTSSIPRILFNITFNIALIVLLMLTQPFGASGAVMLPTFLVLGAVMPLFSGNMDFFGKWGKWFSTKPFIEENRLERSIVREFFVASVQFALSSVILAFFMIVTGSTFNPMYMAVIAFGVAGSTFFRVGTMSWDHWMDPSVLAGVYWEERIEDGVEGSGELPEGKSASPSITLVSPASLLQQAGREVVVVSEPRMDEGSISETDTAIPSLYYAVAMDSKRQAKDLYEQTVTHFNRTKEQSPNLKDKEFGDLHSDIQIQMLMEILDRPIFVVHCNASGRYQMRTDRATCSKLRQEEGEPIIIREISGGNYKKLYFPNSEACTAFLQSLEKTGEPSMGLSGAVHVPFPRELLGELEEEPLDHSEPPPTVELP